MNIFKNRYKNKKFEKLIFKPKPKPENIENRSQKLKL